MLQCTLISLLSRKDENQLHGTSLHNIIIIISNNGSVKITTFFTWMKKRQNGMKKWVVSSCNREPNYVITGL